MPYVPMGVSWATLLAMLSTVSKTPFKPAFKVLKNVPKTPTPTPGVSTDAGPCARAFVSFILLSTYLSNKLIFIRN